eukprot:TRINITY_DN80731_c0_g1_i1.p1 TRINITY_DN80731_c0_g1~~TRINITY_DN80731_c0_g1_i1.p1  ORF type:complete len:398 (-),score=65.20 TRINITY_DN80731_c0_g1_i1:72-1265(-)
MATASTPVCWKTLVTGAAAGAGGSMITVLFLLKRYLQSELKRPDLIHAPMEERDLEDQHLLQEVKLLLREYWPHPVLEFSGYTSTIWSGFWAVLPTSAPGRLEVLTLRDGGTVSLHWGEQLRSSSGKGIALLLPGLNNDSRTSFMQSTMRHVQQEGFQAVTLNYRGTGGLELTSPNLGGATSWRDLPEVVEHIEKSHPGAKLFAVGFSMGGGILLRHLGEEGPRTRFQAAVTVAAAVDHPKVVAALESSIKKRVLNFLMASGMKLVLAQGALQAPCCAGLFDKGKIMRATSIRQIDELTMCLLAGHKSSEEFYESVSPAPKLSRVAVPTLVIHAEDDPVVSVKTLPVEEMRRNPRIYVTITRRGGHIGWGSGGLGAAAWTDNMAVDFMQACALRSRL